MGICHSLSKYCNMKSFSQTKWTMVITKEQSLKKASFMQCKYDVPPKTMYQMLICALNATEPQGEIDDEISVFISTKNNQMNLHKMSINEMKDISFDENNYLSFKVDNSVYLCKTKKEMTGNTNKKSCTCVLPCFAKKVKIDVDNTQKHQKKGDAAKLL